MTRRLALAAATLTACIQPAQLPPPKEPEPNSDGYPQALARGCQTVEACEALVHQGETRLQKCEQDFAVFTQEAERRGYAFRPGTNGNCPYNVTAALDAARGMLKRAKEWADPATGALADPVTFDERRDHGTRANRQGLQRVQAERDEAAAREQEQRKADAAAVAAANERDVLAGTRAGLVAASVALCERRAELADLKSQRAEMLRLDRASGTIDLAERRDLAAEILGDEDVVACGVTIIRKRWRAAPLPCPKAQAESEAGDVQKLFVGGYQRELIDCNLEHPEAGQ